MEPNVAVNHSPVNFFAKGADYISDKFDMTIIDTANVNAFEDFEFVSSAPDMMQNYVEADKAQVPVAGKTSSGILESIASFFTPPKEDEALAQ